MLEICVKCSGIPVQIIVRYTTGTGLAELDLNEYRYRYRYRYRQLEKTILFILRDEIHILVLKGLIINALNYSIAVTTYFLQYGTLAFFL